MGSQNAKIRILDISQSGIRDNGLSFVALAIRKSDQLEELYLSSVGHHGFDFVLGVVEHCNRLRKIHVDLLDVPTVNEYRQMIEAKDYDTADYTKERNEEEEGNEGNEED